MSPHEPTRGSRGDGEKASKPYTSDSRDGGVNKSTRLHSGASSRSSRLDGHGDNMARSSYRAPRSPRNARRSRSPYRAPHSRRRTVSRSPYGLDHTLARHQSPRDVASMTGFVHAHLLVTKVPAPATSDLALRTTIMVPHTRTLDASKSTTRKRRRPVNATTDTLHVEGRAVSTKVDFHTMQETTVDFPAATWTYPYAMSEAGSPITPPQAMQR